MVWCRICGLALLFLLLTSHPIHAYERDVHYDLTKFLVRWAGFSEDEAEQIATADQEIDAKSEFNPLPNPNFCPELRKIAGPASALVAIPVVCKNDPEFQRMLTAQRAYHFVDSERLRALRESAFQGRNLKILGHYLHALQDTFAHSLMDYADLPPLDKLVASLGRLPDEKILGHFLYGHSLDKTYERPDLAEQMARYVYAELARFKGSVNRWNDIDAAVARFVREQDSQKKLAYLSASTLQGPAPTTSQPPSLRPDKSQEPRHEGRTFVEWQADLRDPSPAVREKAALALGNFGPTAVPILTQTLRDSDANVRWAAADALGRIGPAAKDAVPALLQALKDSEAIVRQRAEIALRQIDQTALIEWQRAERARRDEEARLRNEAAQRQAQQQREPCYKLDNSIGSSYAITSGLKMCVEVKAGDEARKAAAEQLAETFKNRHGVREMVGCEALSRNPFAFEGATIGVQVTFDKMADRGTGVFRGRAGPQDRGMFGPGASLVAGCPVVVSGIPQGIFGTKHQEVVLAARVLGRAGDQGYPHLQFSGVHICKEGDCADFFGPASMR